MSNEQSLKAHEYIKKHRLMPLFQRLCSLLILHKPENPKQFLLNCMKNNENMENELILNDNEIELMFQMLENPIQSHKGFVFGHQIISTLNILNLSNYYQTETTTTMTQTNHSENLFVKIDSSKKYEINQFKKIMHDIISNL